MSKDPSEGVAPTHNTQSTPIDLTDKPKPAPRAMTEEASRFWSFRLELVKFGAFVIAGAFALWQYGHTSRHQWETTVWEKQVELYFTASETAARLAYRPLDTKWYEDKDQFWSLYNGSLCLVEDRKVEAGMVNFSKVLADMEGLLKEQDRVRDKDPQQIRSLNDSLKGQQERLKPLSIKLSYAFRDSLSAKLSSSLPSLQGLKLE